MAVLCAYMSRRPTFPQDRYGMTFAAQTSVEGRALYHDRLCGSLAHMRLGVRCVPVGLNGNLINSTFSLDSPVVSHSEYDCV